MTSHKLSVLIVDDHHLVRDGIRAMLESQIDKYQFKITESPSGEDSIEKVRKNNYDIVLMDYQLPKMNGAETVYKLLVYKPQLKVLALSNYDEHSYIKKIIEAGAKGYILKNINPAELVTAIETIVDGKMYYANDVATKLIHHKPASNGGMTFKDVTLSKREVEVLRCIANELSNDETAVKLNIKKRTVDSHRQNLINKLNVKNTVGLVKYALELNII